VDLDTSTLQNAPSPFEPRGPVVGVYGLAKQRLVQSTDVNHNDGCPRGTETLRVCSADRDAYMISILRGVQTSTTSPQRRSGATSVRPDTSSALAMVYVSQEPRSPLYLGNAVMPSSSPWPHRRVWTKPKKRTPPGFLSHLLPKFLHEICLLPRVQDNGG
jgi:hypothetical protein